MQSDDKEIETLKLLPEHSSFDDASHENDGNKKLHPRSDADEVPNMMDALSNQNSCSTMVISNRFDEVASAPNEPFRVDYYQESMGRDNLVAMTPVSTTLIKKDPTSKFVKKSCMKKGSLKKNSLRRFNPKAKSFKKSDSMESMSNFSIIDEDAHRVVNPLCDIPRVDGPSQTAEPPNANDAFVYTDLVFSKDNTYPLSYFARLLGFQVKPVLEDKYVALDPNAIPRVWDHPKIPPLGVITDLMKEYSNPQMYLDPVYAALLEERWDFVDSLNKAAVTSQNRLSEPCLNLARDILGGTYSEISIDDRDGEFRIVSEDLSITYEFIWFQVSTLD
jgi:hypothetical protein